jgi:hypothetical protein
LQGDDPGGIDGRLSKGRRRGSEHAAPTSGAGTQHLQVTPENVVDLAVTFRQIVQRYDTITLNLDQNLKLQEPWLGDPFSKWAQDEFNSYFVDNENSIANIIKQQRNQYREMFLALKKAADQYGMTDELNARLMNNQGSTT